jgi:hypothetical protein
MSKIHFEFSKYKKIAKRNKRFDNIHNGKRCFIIGTGPSLKKINPECLKGEVIFGVNFLYKGDFLNTLKPDYYCLYDQIFHTTHLVETKEIIELFPETLVFMRTKAYDVINRAINMKKDNIFFQHCNLFQHENCIQTDLTKSVTAPFNVLLGCIQTAIYMGFKEIYLLGSDFNSFAIPRVLHYYDKDKIPERNMTLGFELKFYSMVAYHHYALRKYADSKGIKIINLTEESLLDAYPKEKLEDVLRR